MAGYFATQPSGASDASRTSIASATQTLSVVGVVALTNLALAVVAGVSYRVRGAILYTSAANGTGFRIGATHPGGSMSLIEHIPAAASGTTSTFHGLVIVGGGDAVSATTPTATPDLYVALIDGLYVCTANGTFQITGATEVNASNIVVQVGSRLTLEE